MCDDNNLQSHPYMVIERFENTCPLLLSNEHRLDPYLEIESFFDGASLGYYRREIRSWFRIAMTENMEVKKCSEMIYFHNQLIQLLQAGHLIVENDIKHPSLSHDSEAVERFKEWVSVMKDKKIDEGTGTKGSYDIQLLSDAEIVNPLFYLRQLLTLKRIAEIRFGLQEWLYCSLNGKSSIATMEAKHVFGLFEDIEKLLEMLFILINGVETVK